MTKDTSQKIIAFRQAVHHAYCGKWDQDEKCPKKCPARSENLSVKNWDKITIKDMMKGRKK